jgi:hypothetical protein
MNELKYAFINIKTKRSACDVYHPGTDLSHSESMYTIMPLHPTLSALIMNLCKSNFRYIAGEEPLSSMCVYLENTIPHYDH